MKFYKITLYLIILASILPIFLFIDFPDYSAISDKSLANDLYIGIFASIIGLVGGILLLWLVILGNRFIDKVIPDLIWVNSLHKKIGKYGYLFILMHPLLTIYSYGENLLYLFLPNELTLNQTEFETHVAIGRIAFYTLTFIALTSIFLRKKLSYRLWKRMHFLSYIIFPLIFIHAPEIGLIIKCR
ncbi:MAG: ferric reductase-like transmembrane domain-containing protein [Candidatus Dojkabacteria bacterium]|nr:ferric reductase-like transmembrane domain-containing protein [Candidatus Dojkabacteria bacterium]